MILIKKQFFFIVTILLVMSSINLDAQSETNKKPIFVPSENLPSLLNKKPKNILPIDLNIKKNNSEPKINMDISEQEKIIYPSEYKTSPMN